MFYSLLPFLIMILLLIFLIAIEPAAIEAQREHEFQMFSPSQIYSRGLLRLNRAPAVIPSLHDQDNWPLVTRTYNFSKLRGQLFGGDADCLRDIETILSSAYPGKKEWALKYLDAWAKPPAGIMNGDYLWYGDFDECITIEPVNLPSTNTTLNPQYCRLGLTPFSQPNTTVPETLMTYNMAMTFGVCVSSSCTDASVAIIFNELLPTKSGLHVSYPATYCQKTELPLNNLSYIAIGTFSAIGFFIVVGLVVDLICRFRNWMCSWNKSATVNSSLTDVVFGDGTTTGSNTNLEVPSGRRRMNIDTTDDDPMAAALCDGDSASLILPLPGTTNSHANNNINNGNVTSMPPQTRPKSPVSLMAKLRKLSLVLICFSPYTNLGKLCTLPPAIEIIPNLNALNAIRVLSIFWVILGHTYAFLMGTFDNLWTAIKLPETFPFQVVLSGIFAVDTFFFLSGFFAYWSLSRQLDLLRTSARNKAASANRGRLWFWKSLPFIYVHRFLRLAPPYMAIVLIDLCLWRYLSNGPFYFQGVDSICLKNWWTNLLFINNFMDMTSQCVGWGWYLAVDMQLFLFAPFIIVLFAWRPRWAWFASFFALFAQAVAAITITYVYHLPSSLFSPTDGNLTAGMPGGDEAYNKYFDYIYVKPYCRLGPYVVGIIFGHIVVRHSLYLTRNLFTRSLLPAALWMLCFSTMFTLIYGLYGIHAGHYTNPVIADALYNALARTAWGFVVGWIVLAAVVNRAGPFGRILSWPGWALPAKLTYAAYLTHPLILIFFAQTGRRPFHLTDLTITFTYCGILVVTFIVSALFSLAFESPIISMQRLASSVLF